MVRLLWLDTLARWLIEISTLETLEMPHIHTYICRKSLSTRSCNVEAVWTFSTSIMSIHIILLVLCHYVERPSTTFTSLDVGGILLHLWERQPFISPGEAWESHCTRWRTRESRMSARAARLTEQQFWGQPENARQSCRSLNWNICWCSI